MALELKTVEETEGVLWSVRENGTVFLITRTPYGLYDVHVVADGGVEHIGNTSRIEGPEGALDLIRIEIEG